MKRDHLGAALVLLALAVLLGSRGAWGALGLVPAVLGCFLLAAPRLRAAGVMGATSPVAITPGRRATIAPPGALAPAWRPATHARTRGRPPWAASAAPGGAWDQYGAFARPPESHPYPPTRIAKAARVLELEAAALEDDLVMAPTGEALDDGPPGWVIVQPTTRTPPRMYQWAGAVLPAVEAPRDPLGLLEGEALERSRLAADPDHCPVCASRLFTADGPHCGACGWQSPGHRAALEQDEALERLAETAEITAVHQSAEYRADLEEQDSDAADFIAASERRAFEWAAALARELEAERAGWKR